MHIVETNLIGVMLTLEIINVNMKLNQWEIFSEKMSRIVYEFLQRYFQDLTISCLSVVGG